MKDFVRKGIDKTQVPCAISRLSDRAMSTGGEQKGIVLDCVKKIHLSFPETTLKLLQSFLFWTKSLRRITVFSQAIGATVFRPLPLVILHLPKTGEKNG